MNLASRDSNSVNWGEDGIKLITTSEVTPPLNLHHSSISNIQYYSTFPKKWSACHLLKVSLLIPSYLEIDFNDLWLKDVSFWSSKYLILFSYSYHPESNQLNFQPLWNLEKIHHSNVKIEMQHQITYFKLSVNRETVIS